MKWHKMNTNRQKMTRLLCLKAFVANFPSIVVYEDFLFLALFLCQRISDMRASSLQEWYWIGPISENVSLRVISVVSAGHNHFWILDDVTNMDVVVGPRGNSFITLFEPQRLCSRAISHETLQNYRREAPTHKIDGDRDDETKRRRVGWRCLL